MNEPEQGLAISLKRLVLDPAKPPEAAHAFSWARVGSEFLFEVGFLDLREMHVAATESQKSGDKVPVPLYINHRFSLSPDAVRQLASTVNAMVAELEERGL